MGEVALSLLLESPSLFSALFYIAGLVQSVFVGGRTLSQGYKFSLFNVPIRGDDASRRR